MYNIMQIENVTLRHILLCKSLEYCCSNLEEFQAYTVMAAKSVILTKCSLFVTGNNNISEYAIYMHVVLSFLNIIKHY